MSEVNVVGMERNIHLVLEADKFMKDIDNKDYSSAIKRFEINPQLTAALPLSYVKEGYWQISKEFGYEKADEFLESCERALNDGEENKSLRQLVLKRDDPWSSGVHN